MCYFWSLRLLSSGLTLGNQGKTELGRKSCQAGDCSEVVGFRLSARKQEALAQGATHEVVERALNQLKFTPKFAVKLHSPISYLIRAVPLKKISKVSCGVIPISLNSLRRSTLP